MIVVTRSARTYRLPVVVDSTLPKTDQVVLSDDVQIEHRNGDIQLIRKGFVTDFHSTPVYTWAVLPPYNARTNLAAVSHDDYYMNQRPGISRKEADARYLELMNRFAPDRRGRNYLYYLGVRTFGWWNWRKFRRQNSRN